jgi:hypothetical protein
MKGTYKPPHSSPDNMNTHSITRRLDYIEDQLNKIQEDITWFNEKLDNEMDEKFNNFENMLNENMMGM